MALTSRQLLLQACLPASHCTFSCCVQHGLHGRSRNITSIIIIIIIMIIITRCVF
jgi:hypothetical protein